MSQSLQYGFQTDRLYGPYYRHSGKVTMLGGLLAAVVGLACGFLAAWAYAYVDTYLPVVQLNALACAAFGAAVGLIPALVMRWGKVRNIPVALAIVTVLTLATYYMAWCAWVHVTFHRVDSESFITFDLLLKEPSLAWQCILAINEHGTWSMGSHGSTGQNVSGVSLWIIWGVEAATIFTCALLAAKMLLADRPFCESCVRWCAKPTQIATSGAGDVETLRQHLERRDFTVLQGLGRATSPGRWLEYTLHRCDTCNKLATLTLTQVTVTIDKKKKSQTDRKVLLDKLLIEPEDVEKLKANLATTPPTASLASATLVPPPTSS